MRRTGVDELVIRDFNPGERARVETYLSLDEQLLYSLIPPYVVGEGVLYSPEGQREAGRDWFATRRSQFEQKVCAEWEMCRRLADPNFEDAAKLVIVVGDAVATVVAGVPPILVASIIVRIGIRNFCNCPKELAS